MTLSQTAVLVKQIITISILALVLGIAGFIGYKIWYAYYLSTLPPQEEKPDTKFGPLPNPSFPKGTVSSSNFSYTIDTFNGNLPQIGQDKGFDKIIKVYFVIKTLATFLSPEKSQNLAGKFDIKSQPQILSETNYLFKEADKSLNVDLDTGNFVYRNGLTPPEQTGLDDDNKLVSDFQRTLENLGVLSEDIKKGRSKIFPLKNNAGQLTPTDVRAEANAAQISLWPTPIDNKPILTSQYNVSIISANVYKSASNINNYLLLNYKYFPIDTSTYATYPLKSSDEALADLKNGKGAVVIEPVKPQVSITSIYLGYFLPENYSPYLQPIYVFEGPHFVAYVPAINEQFISQ